MNSSWPVGRAKHKHYREAPMMPLFCSLCSRLSLISTGLHATKEGHFLL